MSFASHDFLFGFLPFALAVVLVAERIDRERLLLPALIGVSVVFYGWGSIPHLLLLLAMVGTTWVAAQVWTRSRAIVVRRTALASGVAANLGALTVWKYGDSLVEAWNALGLVAVDPPGIIMPLGISFYAFQQIGYLMDLRRGRAQVMAPIPYLAFVLFFPQLIAGPIVTQRHMGRELARAREGRSVDTRLRLAWLGVAWFSIGLFKKTVIADSIARETVPLIAEASYGPISTLGAWVVAVAPPTQVYFDFAGYSDMAVGLALLFGIRIPPNFNAAYRSRTAREFWRRWHITFHRFVRDHLYAPLMRRMGHRPLGAAVALATTIALSSLWHGDSLQFLLWGVLLYVTILVTGNLFARLSETPRKIAVRLTIISLFLMMNVLFTTPDLATAGRVFEAMVVPAGMVDARDPRLWAVLGGLLLLLFVTRQEISTQVLLEADRDHRERHAFGWRPPAFALSWPWVAVIGTTLLVAVSRIGYGPDFVYFGI